MHGENNRLSKSKDEVTKMNDIYQRARGFIGRNARPLDYARWQYQFENGSKNAVLEALTNYQNDDGGFGHALEPDAWNPNSSPIQTWTATEILREIDFTDKTNQIITKILKYLESGKDFDGMVWYNTIKSNNEYPHAPWWHIESVSTCHSNYNPTACLAGFIIRFAEKDTALYNLGCRIAKEAFNHLKVTQSQLDMHTTSCYIRLLQYIEEAGEFDIIDLSVLKNILLKHVESSITQNTKEWETSYICKPSQFFDAKDSIFYEENKDIAEYECEYIIKTQLEDGSWNIPWSWSDYWEEWAISKNWWKSHVILQNLIYLKGFSII
jgi:hypothetical protein